MKTETKIDCGEAERTPKVDWPFDYATCMNPVCSKRSKCARHHTNHTKRGAYNQNMFSPAEDKCNSYVDLNDYINEK